MVGEEAGGGEEFSKKEVKRGRSRERKSGKERERKDQCNSNGFKRVVFKARRPRESLDAEKGGTGTKNGGNGRKGEGKGDTTEKKSGPERGTRRDRGGGG